MAAQPLATMSWYDSVDDPSLESGQIMRASRLDLKLYLDVSSQGQRESADQKGTRQNHENVL
jgi:hypothetical protein